MSALSVTGRFGCNGVGGASAHGIIMFFVDLHILAKFGLDVFVVINFDAGDEFPGVDIPRDTVLWRKHIEPEISGADHLDDEHLG
jgi:hypothetical protein